MTKPLFICTKESLCDYSIRNTVKILAHTDQLMRRDQNRLMAAGPEWIVQYREWPAYRLFVRRYRWRTLPPFLNDTLRLVDKGSWSWTNTMTIGELDGGGVELESDGWFLEKIS